MRVSSRLRKGQLTHRAGGCGGGGGDLVAGCEMSFLAGKQFGDVHEEENEKPAVSGPMQGRTDCKRE